MARRTSKPAAPKLSHADLGATEIETMPSEHAVGGKTWRYFIPVNGRSIMAIGDVVVAHHKALGERAAVCFANGMRGTPDRPGHLVALVWIER